MPETVSAKLFSDRGLIILSFICAAVILFTDLGGGGIPAAQEGRTAIIVRNMLLSGNWMDMNVPYGIPYEKPVGHYWLCLPTSALCGVGAAEPGDAPAEWGVRLPSAISAMLALAAAAILAFRIYGARTCALTVLCLSTMSGFVHLGRLAHIDMPLAAAFAWAMLFLYIGYYENMKANGWIYGFYAMLGWGMILKGPLVILLAGIVVVCMMCWTRHWKMIWEIRPLTGCLLFLAVSLPWYIAETIRTDGAFFNEFIINQNFRRFTGIGSTYKNGKYMPVYYYIVVLMTKGLPWAVFALLALILNFKRIVLLRFEKGTAFLFFWFAGTFVFFSLSALKRGDYLLPLYVPFGILTAAFLLDCCEKLKGVSLSRKWIWVWLAVMGLCVVFLILSFSGVLTWFVRTALQKPDFPVSKSDLKNLGMISSYMNSHILLICSCLIPAGGLLFLFGWMIQRAKWKQVLLAFAFASVLIYVVFYSFIDARTAVIRTVKPFTIEARKIIPPGTPFVHCGDFNTELLFLMNRPYTCEIKPDTRYVITTPESLPAMMNGPEPHWKILLQTCEDHHYPAVLLERIR